MDDCILAQFNPSSGYDIPVKLAEDNQVLNLDICIHSAVGTNRQTRLSESYGTFQRSIHEQVFVPGQLSLKADRLADQRRSINWLHDSTFSL